MKHTTETLKKLKKSRIIKMTYQDGTVQYQIQQRHFLFRWMWVAAWVNSWMGASAPSDTFSTLDEAIEGLTAYENPLVSEEVVQF